MAQSLSESLKNIRSSSIKMQNLSTLSLNDEVAAYSDEVWVDDTSGTYKKYSYIDDLEASTIDRTKKVKINANQVNISQESNSQAISFIIDRRWDNIDLTEMDIRINFVNAEGNWGFSYPINMQYTSDKIRFIWLVDSTATAVTGKLQMEVYASGKVGDLDYVWRTQPNSDINIIESLEGDGVIEPSEGWNVYIKRIESIMNEAKDAASSAQTYANSAQAAASTVDAKISNVSEEISNEIKESISTDYITRKEAETKHKELDASVEAINKKLSTFTVDPTEEWSSNFKSGIKTDLIDPLEQKVTEVQEKADQSAIDIVGLTQNMESVTEKFNEYYTQEEVDGLLDNVQVDLSGYYTSIQTDELLKNKAEKNSVTALENSVSQVSFKADTNKASIDAFSSKIVELEEKINEANTDPSLKYRAKYETDTGLYSLVEITIDKDGEETEEVVSQFTISGGAGGGSSSATTVTIDRITASPLTLTKNDSAVIKYKFTSVDTSGDDTGEGTAIWKVGNKVVATTMALQGENSFDVTDYISVGQNKVTLTITDSAGSLSVKNWTVQVIDLYLESTFNDQYTYPLGNIAFSYTPYGAIEKTIHFKLDNVEIGTVKTSSSGIPMSYTLPSQSHGAHLVEVYATAELNNTTIETNHIYKDIIWYDENSDIPVISCIYTNITAKQYDSTSIVYSVYDPTTESPKVTLAIDGEVSSTLTLEQPTNTWVYKTSEVGSHTLTITCGETVKTINIEVEKLDIDVTPVTANIVFDFNPTGRSNNGADRLWSDNDITMTVSDNFDWINGGYQLDENGDQYFCVKSGTTATINHNLFSDDPKRNGKEFKVIFKTTNVRKRDTSFISCMENGIGLDMKVEKANIYSSNDSLYAPYCEDDIIEFEFNINKNTDIPMVLTYEDGVPNRPMIYTSDTSFMQTNPQPIVIGSEDCDVHIYRMKAYSASLSDRDVQSNFIADARNAEEMISRHNRNQIYDENSALTPEGLAEKCPDLRIIIVDAPWFTNDKSNKVDDTTITMIYKNGDSVLDNWTCTGAKHSGQGTSSNEYGYSGRNLDLIMDGDDALFAFGDGETTGKTMTLTRNSVPTDYLNIKVNVASSDNENNAQLTNRYNDYNPFKRTAKLIDPKIRDTMEFYNCVVFVRERNEDISTHREFSDTNTHFYAIGNIGDSKKTDDTRVNDKNDPKEHVIEVMDYNVALAEFPTGKADENGHKIICPESDWKEGNTAYDYLYADYKYKDGKFKSFGSESYEFRYEKSGITTEEREANINAWREAYKFVVTSDDETFVKDFEKYFVKDSILYFYLFTERYLLTDNRAKNLFLHYGKVWYSPSEAKQFKETYNADIESKYIDETQASFNEGYRYDLAFGYDFDRHLSK